MNGVVWSAVNLSGARATFLENLAARLGPAHPATAAIRQELASRTVRNA